MACTSQDVAGLTPAQLVTYLHSTTYDCLYRFVWNLDSGLAGVLTTAHVTTVLDEVTAQVPAYTGDDGQQLRELMHFVHAAYFLRANNPNNTALFTPDDVRPAAERAFDAFAANPHFLDFATTPAAILYDWATAVDGANLGERYDARFVAILGAFNNDSARWDVYWHQLAQYGAMRAIARQSEINAAFRAGVSQALVTGLATSAGNVNLPASGVYLASNAVWALGAICGQVPARKVQAVQAITNARALWPRFSGPWLWTVETLDRCNDCLDAAGQRLCRDDVVADLMTRDFPNTFVFDDGALIVRTPLAEDRVQVLYHAVKTVEGQFNRLTQTIAPLADDPTDRLTVFIFGSRDEYRRDATFLFGISVDNGGIYVEPGKALYTFDRTAQQSIFPLEELVRHEFAHYLVGRFLIAGMWGEAPIYRRGRLVWFDEGLAEFLTWSTTGAGIRPRRLLVQLIQADGTDRMSVADVLNVVAYGGHKFYNYAGMLFSCLYERSLATLLKVIDLVRAGNVEGYDLQISAMKADTNLQTVYGQYLDACIANINGLDDPSTTVPPLQALDLATAADVQARFRRTRLGYGADCAVSAIESNTRFSARGVLTGPLVAVPDTVEAWQLFNDNLDELIGDLSAQGVNNFSALNGRFGKIRWNEYGSQIYPVGDFYVDGPLPHHAGGLLPPQQQVRNDFRSTRLGVNVQASQISPTLVQASLSLTTRLYPSSVGQATLMIELEEARVELRDQVYAIRPPYYRKFRVEWAGDLQVIHYVNDQRYGLRNVVCTIDLS